MNPERFLLARIGTETFAFPLAEVLEATDATEVTPLALLPSGVAGQSVYRDRLLPVIDGSMLLGVTRSGPKGVLLVIEVDGDRVALWADDVVDMVTVDPRRFRAVPAGGSGTGTMLRAVVDLGDVIAAVVSMDDVRAFVRARLMTEVA
ncbi:MAG: chemotaxis protein CheW [Gemmatimonadetes bacterium]|nr:chemotaxis protein CheW [Gemmatimonadota bacterium]